MRQEATLSFTYAQAISIQITYIIFYSIPIKSSHPTIILLY